MVSPNLRTIKPFKAGRKRQQVKDILLKVFDFQADWQAVGSEVFRQLQTKCWEAGKHARRRRG